MKLFPNSRKADGSIDWFNTEKANRWQQKIDARFGTAEEYRAKIEKAQADKLEHMRLHNPAKYAKRQAMYAQHEQAKKARQEARAEMRKALSPLTIFVYLLFGLVFVPLFVVGFLATAMCVVSIIGIPLAFPLYWSTKYIGLFGITLVKWSTLYTLDRKQQKAFRNAGVTVAKASVI